jgi:hypothetical protein
VGEGRSVFVATADGRDVAPATAPLEDADGVPDDALGDDFPLGRGDVRAPGADGVADAAAGPAATADADRAGEPPDTEIGVPFPPRT